MALRLIAAMTTIWLSDPSMVELLLADLKARPDVVAEIVEPDRIRISLLGSYSSDAMRLAILLRVRAREAVRRARGIDVESSSNKQCARVRDSCGSLRTRQDLSKIAGPCSRASSGSPTRDRRPCA